MGVAEVKVTIPSKTGLPEDSIVNVFHVADVGATPGVMAARFGAFYTTVYNGESIGGLMSPVISNAPSACTVDVYDLADPAPRAPVAAAGFTIPATAATTGLPTEVALCVSWLAAVESGVPAGRRRGRNFLGPWSSVVLTDTEPTRPSATLINTIVAAATDLLDDVALVVYSTASIPPVARPVVGGYVDNAWDTMRSRGEETSARTSFSAP